MVSRYSKKNSKSQHWRGWALFIKIKYYFWIDWATTTFEWTNTAIKVLYCCNHQRYSSLTLNSAATRLGVAAANALFCIISCLENTVVPSPMANTSKFIGKKIVVIADNGDSNGDSTTQTESDSKELHNLFVDNLDHLLQALRHIKIVCITTVYLMCTNRI